MDQRPTTNDQRPPHEQIDPVVTRCTSRSELRPLPERAGIASRAPLAEETPHAKAQRKRGIEGCDRDGVTTQQHARSSPFFPRYFAPLRLWVRRRRVVDRALPLLIVV